MFRTIPLSLKRFVVSVRRSNKAHKTRVANLIHLVYLSLPFSHIHHYNTFQNSSHNTIHAWTKQCILQLSLTIFLKVRPSKFLSTFCVEKSSIICCQLSSKVLFRSRFQIQNLFNYTNLNSLQILHREIFSTHVNVIGMISSRYRLRWLDKNMKVVLKHELLWWLEN